MTNADRIRNMSDEELADLLAQFTQCDKCSFGEEKQCTTNGCKEGHRLWLKQEASKYGS